MFNLEIPTTVPKFNEKYFSVLKLWVFFELKANYAVFQKVVNFFKIFFYKTKKPSNTLLLTKFHLNSTTRSRDMAE